VQKLVRRYDTYSLSGASPLFPVLDMMKNSKMWGMEDLRLGMAYSSGWSVSISLSVSLRRYMLSRAYIPSRFARQFGYDQLYVGNPNLRLAFMGSLIDGARA